MLVSSMEKEKSSRLKRSLSGAAHTFVCRQHKVIRPHFQQSVLRIAGARSKPLPDTTLPPAATIHNLVSVFFYSKRSLFQSYNKCVVNRLLRVISGCFTKGRVSLLLP